MASFTVEMILKLVDQLSGPARKARAELAGLKSATGTVSVATAATSRLRGQWLSVRDAVGTFRSALGVELATIRTASSEIGEGFSRIRRSIGSAAGQAWSLARGLTRAAAFAGVTAGGLVALGKAYSDTVDEQAKFARQIGFSVQGLRRLGFVADRQGVSIEGLNGGLERFVGGLGQARKNAGPLAAFLKKSDPGLLKTLKAAAPEEAFDLVIGKLAEFRKKDPALAEAFARAAFGRGSDMSRIAELGPEGFKAMMAEADRILGVLPATAADDAEAFADAFGDVRTAVLGLRDAIASALLPQMTPLLNDLRDWVAAHRELIATKVVDTVKAIAGAIASVDWGAVATTIGQVAEAFNGVAQALGGWENVILGLIGLRVAIMGWGILLGLKQIVSGIGLFAAALWRLAPAAAAAAWGVLRLAAAGLGAVVSGFASLATSFVRFTGGAVVGFFRSLAAELAVLKSAGIGALAGGIARLALSLGVVTFFIAGVVRAWDGLVDALGRLVSGDLLGAVDGALRSLGQAFNDMIRELTGIDVAGAIVGGLRAAEPALKAWVEWFRANVIEPIRGWIAELGGLMSQLGGAVEKAARPAFTASDPTRIEAGSPDEAAQVEAELERLRDIARIHDATPKLMARIAELEAQLAALKGTGGAAAATTGPAPTIPEMAQTIDNSKTVTQSVTVNNSITVNATTPASPAAIGAAVAGGAERGVRSGAAALHDGGMVDSPTAAGQP